MELFLLKPGYFGYCFETLDLFKSCFSRSLWHRKEDPAHCHHSGVKTLLSLVIPRAGRTDASWYLWVGGAAEGESSGPHQASVDTTLVPTAPQTLAGQSNSTSQLYLVGERKRSIYPNILNLKTFSLKWLKRLTASSPLGTLSFKTDTWVAAATLCWPSQALKYHLFIWWSIIAKDFFTTVNTSDYV